MIEGSVEILHNAGTISEGLVVTTPEPGRIPEALAILRGLDEFAEAETDGADRAWTARTHDGQDVRVLFRELRLEGPRVAT